MTAICMLEMPLNPNQPTNQPMASVAVSVMKLSQALH